MTDSSAYRVETTSRLAQWRIENLACCSYRRSDPFKIGKWNWHLSVEKNRVFFVKLFPEMSNLTKENPPVASFRIRVICSACNRKTFTHPEITGKQLKTNEDFIWALEVPFTGKIIIDVEFLDLKTTSPDTCGEPCSIWVQGVDGSRSNATAISCLAHRAILTSRSPVFCSMFAHGLKEKELSIINITDMSIEACDAFLNYTYGNIQHEKFLNHRLALSDKYDITDLKEACHNSLLEDIDTANVLKRLQIASLYQLPKLKSSCMHYLVNFGKIFDIRDGFSSFMQYADRDLIAEIFHEVLNAWKEFRNSASDQNRGKEEYCSKFPTRGFGLLALSVLTSLVLSAKASFT
ncbi:hypothetical protein K2173_015489 [Erythroxylum novogranatense]|uniref:BTB domain-containing protein n=1 Tax=Erythroxylum novogranatense TaxID=1862640 RepID=A0AAV8SRS3_9ROSI|nr:hypothetical protein K2173_015489 [Erythroxylum novogranatense]